MHIQLTLPVAGFHSYRLSVSQHVFLHKTATPRPLHNQ